MSLESAYTTQSLFLKRIEDLIGNSSSLVFEMYEILNISTDSAYLRMSGETLLSIDENIKKYEFYYSEIEITNNCDLINLGFSKAVYLSHFSFYTMKNMNETYCNSTEDWLKSLIKKNYS